VFALAIIAETSREPADFVGRAMQKGMHRMEELNYWSKLFRTTKARYLVYGTVLVQRHAAEDIRAPFTVRLQKGPDSGPAESEWALNWNSAASQPGAAELVLNSCPKLSPYLHLAVLHRVQDGGLVPEQFLMRVRHPFESECKCPAWVAQMLSHCTGERTGLELLGTLKEHQIVQQDTEPAEFAEVRRALIASGFMSVPAHPIPQRA